MFRVGADLALFAIPLGVFATLPLIMGKVFVLKMDSRGLDIAITTIVLIIIGIAVLIGLVFFVKNGFGFLKAGTEPLLKTESLEASRQACELLCRSGNDVAFCCEGLDMNGEDVFCSDAMINADCYIDCSKIACS